MSEVVTTTYTGNLFQENTADDIDPLATLALLFNPLFDDVPPRYLRKVCITITPKTVHPEMMVGDDTPTWEDRAWPGRVLFNIVLERRTKPSDVPPVFAESITYEPREFNITMDSLSDWREPVMLLSREIYNTHALLIEGEYRTNGWYVIEDEITLKAKYNAVYGNVVGAGTGVATTPVVFPPDESISPLNIDYDTYSTYDRRIDNGDENVKQVTYEWNGRLRLQPYDAIWIFRRLLPECPFAENDESTSTFSQAAFRFSTSIEYP